MKQANSTAKRIAISFLLVIFIGSILLWLPISHQPQANVSLIDAIFIATSATCVTGLSPIVVSTTFSLFGQFVILALIQIGGLGLITIMASFVLFLRNRISLEERETLSEMLNRSDLFRFHSFIKKVIRFTLLFELVGAILLFPVFITQFDFFTAVWQSIFTAVSAFCNAGFDILGNQSLAGYHHHYYFQTVIMILIVFGGLGFAVWSDFYDFFKNLQLKKPMFKAIRSISTHTKVVIMLTMVFIVVPAILFYLVEMNTYFKEKPFLDIVYASLFQSVTLRTAGFYTIDFSQLRYASLLMMIPLMFIGGSSGGTAGGIKITTFFVIVAYIVNVMKGRKGVVIFKRSINHDIVFRAFTLFAINLCVLFIGILLLSFTVSDQQIIPYAFEATSALGTVGISTGITANLSIYSKLIIILMMFIGRIGIVTVVFSMRGALHSSSNVGYPTGNIIVG